MKLGKKTKIVCTIGPATESEENLRKLIDAGMNVARLNFSHGDFAEHQARVDRIRKITKETGVVVAIMQDLCGPKIRIGTFKDNFIMLAPGDTFTLTTDEVEGTKEKVHINYPALPKEVKKGTIIMLQDGTKKFEVMEVKGNDIVTKVVVGGRVSGRKGVNVPGANLSVKSLTEKDRADLEFGLKNNVDFIALSFVRHASDILELREILNKAGSKAHIIAKIETPEALEDIDAIIEATDAVMVARGDLAIEIPAEDVPLVQKILIHKCNCIGKPVITATQMLESMIKNSVPTRAEVSDIANAIIDGTDAIMLSEETTLGDYPVAAVEVMTRVALRVEKEVYTRDTIAEYETAHGVTDVVSQSAVRLSHNVEASLIVTLTRGGHTPRMIARYRPAEMILAMTDNEECLNKMMLSFGCYPMMVPTFKTTNEIMDIVRKITLDNKLVKKGDKIVIIAGMPFGGTSETNFILVETL
ncbi:MAG: pyruvate kinase [Candidatus Paceibacterota bacterium]